MSKIAVIYWSGTGNTQAMAEAVAEGAKGAGAQVDLYSVSETSAGAAAAYDTLALGSYGWGDGQWMRDWADRLAASGAAACGEPLTVNEAPDEDGLAQCRALGAALAGA